MSHHTNGVLHDTLEIPNEAPLSMNHHISAEGPNEHHDVNQSPSEDVHASIDLVNGVDTGPRGIKRKLSTPRDFAKVDKKKLPSPPWAKFEATGPTSFTENGMRKSGRHNPLPIDLQPQGATRGKQAAHQIERSAKRQLGSPSVLPQKQPPLKPPHRPLQKPMKPEIAHRSHSRTTSVEKHKISTPVLPTKHVKVEPNAGKARSEEKHLDRRKSGRHGPTMEHTPLFDHAVDGKKGQIDESNIITPSHTVKKLRLNFRRPTLPPPLLNPLNVIPQPKFASLHDCLDHKDATSEESNERPFTQAEAIREAQILRRLEKASRPGGLLHGDILRTEEAVIQSEPSMTPSHPDYLFAHIKMFSTELKKERDRHRRNAKATALLVQEAWLKKQPKTPEEVLEEQRLAAKGVYQKMLLQLLAKWELFAKIARERKLAEHEAQQRKKTDQELRAFADQAAADQLRRQRLAGPRDEQTVAGAEAASPQNMDIASSSDAENSFESEASNSDDDMTSSGSSEGGAEDDANDDGTLVGEALYKSIFGDDWEAHMRETSKRAAIEGNAEEGSQQDEPDGDLDDHHSEDEAEEMTFNAEDEDYYANVQLDDVDETLMDDEEEGNSDSGTEISDEDEETSGHESDSDNEPDTGMLGFFGKSFRDSLQVQPEPVDAQVEMDCEKSVAEESSLQKLEEISPTMADSSHVEETIRTASDQTSTSDESGKDTPATTIASKVSEVDASNDTQILDNAEEVDLVQTPIPSLLRGQLRTYQHQGLNWLAGMYASDTNGILADEMGLGKTIQTISLLAHLADTKGIWGPHLIVVPTSVILNWEMEFKKFCPGFKILTYFGNQEERQEKRKGWMDPDRWHVCITSYQLAIRDQASLKRRGWHYLVLDEAHNIKNFRSQRWQTLLSFKSHSRLLLTGTPLQNNLTELWSLLFFLAPEVDEDGESRFKDLKAFSALFKRPVEQILDNGREALDAESKEIVVKLHTILRPHLLRRLKADVEKQMPKKYEHVIRCRLSKRQRQLYDGYMGLAGTRESFASGNYMSIINCLMQLRKVCNHPDLFETRPILTSFAMPRSAIAGFEIQELLVRRSFFSDQDDAPSSLINLWRQNTPSLHVRQARQLGALNPLKSAFAASRELAKTIAPEGHTSFESSLTSLSKTLQDTRTNDISTAYRETAGNLRTAPVYPIGLLGCFNFEKPSHLPGSKPKRRARLTEWHLNTSTVLQEAFSLSPSEAYLTEVAVRKFSCVTPAVVAPGMAQLALTRTGVQAVESIAPLQAENPFHESQTRLSIAFPDKALIQYDCGKLQQLDRLLRELQSRGSRALIFTQMTKVLDILEQFLNLHGHRYLRLDGSTKIESRQALTEQFNTDPRILAFILSSRSGGLGINLTGADTVIFYDLDWNPAMDKQCQDRCHRIGQTRDVHIYRFVSDGTIEANILKKSNQKRMLDDVVIQEGEFTTDAFYRTNEGDEADEDAATALDKVFGSTNEQAQGQRLLEDVEDKEDVEAARVAQKEDVNVDDADFEEKPTPATQTPDAKFGSPRPAQTEETSNTEPSAAATAEQTTEVEAVEPGHIDDYMFNFKMNVDFRDAIVVTMSEKQRKKAKKGKGHEIRIR